MGKYTELQEVSNIEIVIYVLLRHSANGTKTSSYVN